jgi:hypothetical protein
MKKMGCKPPSRADTSDCATGFSDGSNARCCLSTSSEGLSIITQVSSINWTFDVTKTEEKSVSEQELRLGNERRRGSRASAQPVGSVGRVLLWMGQVLALRKYYNSVSSNSRRDRDSLGEWVYCLLRDMVILEIRTSYIEVGAVTRQFCAVGCAWRMPTGVSP